MSPRALLGALALGAVALCVGSGAQWPAQVAALLAGALGLGAAGLGPRLRLQLFGELLLSLGAVALALALGRAGPVPDADALPLVWTVTAAAALLVYGARLWCVAPVGGELGTFVIGLLALAARGQGKGGGVYVAAVAAYLILSCLWLRRGVPQRLPLRELASKPRALLLLTPLLAAGLGALLVAPLQPLHRMVQAQIDRSFESGKTRVGFGASMRLGALTGMLDSDRLVLRLSGPPVDYLRGVVYNYYGGGRWVTLGFDDRVLVLVDHVPQRGPDVVEAERLWVEPDGPLFLPLGAGALTLSSGEVRVNALSIYHPTVEAARLWWRQGAAPGAVAPPGVWALQIPETLRPPLSAIVAQWTAGATDPATKLARISARLQGYRYSLEFSRPAGQDPVLDFLTKNKQGHCEYFASALALLARSAGIPARVVGGFRVAERNPISGDYLVRDRNAHAWVEAFLPGRGWVTYDATPAGELPQNQPHQLSRLAALWDAAAASLWRRYHETGALQRGLLLGALVLLGFAGRALQQRRARRAAAPVTLREPPLPGFLALEQALALGGAVRDPAETLERFAARLTALLGDEEVARLLRSYAALRYGGVGEREAGTIDQALGRAARRLGDGGGGRGPGTAGR